MLAWAQPLNAFQKASQLVAQGETGLAEDEMRKDWNQFQLIRVPGPSEKPKFIQVQLNKKGYGMDGVRFMTPPNHHHLVWFFSLDADRNDASSWYIFPRKGRDQDYFTHFQSFRDVQLTGYRLPTRNTSFFQQTSVPLSGRHEYAIWFYSTSNRPYTVHIKAKLVNPDEFQGGLDQIAEALEIEPKR